MQVRADDLSCESSKALIRLHLEGMRADSPPGQVSALDYSGLLAPDVTVWSVWDGDELLGIGALKTLDEYSGEVKSMRTHPEHVRKGVAAALLDHIVSEAKARGLARLSLETGSGPPFEPALALYRKRGFLNGGALSDHAATDFNQFLHLDLDEEGVRRAGTVLRDDIADLPDHQAE
jgi:putative acetyltransferase